MRELIEENKIFLTLLSLIFGGVLLLWVADSYLEARAFNNVTGKTVSTWDAMFIELRVQGAANNQ